MKKRVDEMRLNRSSEFTGSYKFHGMINCSGLVICEDVQAGINPRCLREEGKRRTDERKERRESWEQAVTVETGTQMWSKGNCGCEWWEGVGKGNCGQEVGGRWFAEYKEGN